MRFVLSINCGNAAFGETADERAAEVTRLVEATACRMRETGTTQGVLYDFNGNKVGAFSYLADDLVPDVFG